MHAESPNPLVRRFEEEVLVNTQDLYRAAARLTERAADAEDLVQETCLQAFRSFGQLRDARATKTWLFAILRSIFLRRIRSSSRRAEPVSLDDLDAAFPAFELSGGAAEDFPPLRHAMLDEVRQATLRLPFPYREVLVLAHIGGFSYREIARLLEVPMGTVMSRLYRARRMLRLQLSERRPSPSPEEAAE